MKGEVPSNVAINADQQIVKPSKNKNKTTADLTRTLHVILFIAQPKLDRIELQNQCHPFVSKYFIKFPN